MIPDPTELRETNRWGLYSATFPEEWALLQFTYGDIVIATIPSYFTHKEDVQGVFAVVGSFLDGAGGVMAQVKSLGCSDPEVTQLLSSTFNRRSGYIHFCRDLESCEEGEVASFHLKVLTLADPRGFQSEYLGVAGKKLLKQILQEAPLPPGGGSRPGEPGRKEGKADGPSPGDREKRSSRERGKGGGLTERLRSAISGEALDHEVLRKRLEEVKKRREGREPEKGREGEGGEPHPDKGVMDLTAPETRDALTAGTRLPNLTEDLDAFLQKAQDLGRKEAERKAKGATEKRGDTVGGGTIGEQLALRATTNVKGPQIARGGWPGGRGGSGRKKKKKEKKKKKDRRKDKKKKRGGGDPSGGSPGSSRSSSSSSRSSKSSTHKSSSEESLLPPLQKRSKREPGSVLKLLIRQVEEQLSELQGADLGGNPLLGGTKMVAYYHLMIKGGGLQVGSRDGRELFLLANLIDLLRTGQLAILADGLASRFLALQQAQLDNGWGAARHLEMFTPEVQTAAGASMTLEARRHARLIEKARGTTLPRSRNENASIPAWSRGGAWATTSWDGYGDTPRGKGKKGKPKGKGGSGQGKGGGPWRGGSAWEGQGKGDREKAPDKKEEQTK